MRVSRVGPGTILPVAVGYAWTKLSSLLMSSTALVRLAPRRRIAVVVGALLVSFLPTLAQAADDLPSGGNVVAGQATIGGSGNNMLITQSSENAIINWDGFSIGAGNNVAFQNGSGATLNRVTGTGTSFINGGLTATGSLFLINQNGVIIGEHGVIETGGSFVASTLDVANEDFLNGGGLTFSGGTQASVINLGKVSSLGGDVAFIAQDVNNKGSISAPNGTAALVAGHEVLMRDAALNDGKFVVKLGDASSSVIEAGMIAAASVELRANGGNVYALAGNKGGAINATGVSNSGGRIFLTAPGGKVTVKKQIKATRSNGAGGDIFINADIVAIANLLDVSSATGQGGTIDIGASDTITLEGATLDASGYTGGGTIRVGGEYQGGKGLTEDQVQNVQTLLIDELTTLKADGTGNNADGGKIIMWADDTTSVAANISATGTRNGGFAEVSGKLTLDYSGLADLRGGTGTTGTLLLDPANFIIDATEANTIIGNLVMANVLVATNAGGGDAGDIFVNAAINWSSDNTLTLTAHHDVVINADVTATGENAGLVVNYGAGGDYIFGAGGRVTLSDATALLTINGQGYTLIHSLAQLQAMEDNVADFYALAEDIDASATNSGAGFDPVRAFTGDFNGHGHTITDLFINRDTTNYVGLFGETLGATIANIGMVGGSITGHDFVGGLVGYLDGGSITNAYATGAVTGTGSGAGGLVGYLVDGSIENAYATGGVSGDFYVGGLIGEQGSGSITNAYATGAVTGNYYVGGLVGVQDSGGITNAYATGAVTGTGFLVGGLVGRQSGGSITNVYATGTVSGPGDNVGGLVGSQDSGSISNSFWDSDTTGRDNSVGDVAGAAAGTTELRVGGANDAFVSGSYVWSGGTTMSTAVNGTSVPNANWLMIDGETRPFLAFEYSTEIANAHQLQLMAFDLDADYTLIADIDANHTNGTANPSQMWSVSGFVPVGISGNEFIGSFDGQEHTITDLFIDRDTTDYVGLFGLANSATIANVQMVGGSITGQHYVGGLVGRQEDGSINNASATGAVTGTTDSVGGLVGYQNGNGGITNAHASGAVTGVNEVGGLVGYLASGSSITNAYATGTVTGNNSVGGLVGRQFGGNITNAYATGDVTGNNEVGGLSGYQFEGNITNAYAIGAVTGTADSVGGLVGEQVFGSSITNAYATGDVTGDNSVGGLVGEQDDSSITNTYATGEVLGNSDIGGLVGEQTGTNSISNSFWDTVTTGMDVNHGVGNMVGPVLGTTGLTTIEFQDTTGFMLAATGWDFENVWAPPSDGYYPELYALSQVVWAQVDDVSRDYGSANPALTTNVHGGPDIYVFEPAGDVLDFTPVLSTTADATSNVGTYAISENLTVNSDLGETYRVVYSGELTIDPALLTVTANDDTKTYDGSAYTGGNGVSYAGLVNGENANVVLGGLLAYSGTAQGEVNPGQYTITPEGLTASNYTITFVEGTLTLFPTPGMQTNVSSFAYDGSGFGQNVVCADEELLNCELVETQF